MTGIGGVRSGATTTLRRTDEASETNATTTQVPDEQPAGPDAFDVGESTAPRGLRPSSTAVTVPRGDPVLSSEMQNARATANANGPRRTSRSVEAHVADGADDVEETKAAVNAANQQSFVDEMKAAGVAASAPPTQDQLRAYFKTFDSKEKRPEALAAYERYAGAYHVHPSGAGRGDEDVKYSPKTHLGMDGRFFPTAEARDAYANRAMKQGKNVVDLDITTNTPDAWSEVTTKREQHDGRAINDCEGFAYIASDLLGAAGYKTRMVAVDGGGALDHAMVVAKDPSRAGQAHVVSNERTFSPDGAVRTEKQLMDAGYQWAGGGKNARYFTAATQDDAQRDMMAAREAKRR
jgi:hypothetical protein